MTREEYIKFANALKNNYTIDFDKLPEFCDMAISALSAEPCREADDYENEIADLHNRLDIAEYDKERYKEEITTLEAENKGEWIPVSERLPKDDDYRPCTNHEWNDGAVLYCTDKGIVGLGWYYYSTKCWANLDDRWIEQDGRVIAWMPLPEPYKGEREDEK